MKNIFQTSYSLNCSRLKEQNNNNKRTKNQNHSELKLMVTCHKSCE